MEENDVILIIYDIPVKYTHPNGYGVQPSRPRSVIGRFVKAGWVDRIQESVLSVNDPRAIGPIFDAVAESGGKCMVVYGRIVREV